MKIIQEYIKELLFEQDCVVIPDFGGFVANYDYCKLEKEMGHPARKWFAFNELLRTDDGILLTYIAEQESITIAEASKKIKNFVASVRQMMRVDDYFYLKGVGSFCYNEENKIQFIPVYNVNFQANSFGLSAFNVQKLDRPKVLEKIVTRSKEQGSVVVLTNSRSQARVFNDRPMVLSTSLIGQVKKKKKSKREHYLLASMVAIIALFLSFYIYDNKGFTLSNLNFFTSYKSDVYTSSLGKYKTPETVLIKSAIKSSTMNTIAQHQPTYFVIVGSFESQKNAAQFMSQLKKDGYSSAKLISNKKGEKIKVSLDHFTTKDAAIKKASTLENAWIYTSELLR